MIADLLQILENISGLIFSEESVHTPGGGVMVRNAPLQRLMGVILFVMGVYFVIRSLMMTAKRSEMGQAYGSWVAPITTFIVGVMFIAFPALIATLNATFFGNARTAASGDIFALAPLTVGTLDGGAAQTAVTAIVLIIQFIGLIAVARGLYLLNLSTQTASGPRTFGPGLTFIIAGALATNFPVFIGVMENLISTVP